jgi:hypothetical protein
VTADDATPELVAVVEVRSARRYLDQLCAHLGAVGGMAQHGHGPAPRGSGHAPPQVRAVHRGDPDHAVLELAAGTCELQAAGTVLRVVVRGDGPQLESLAAAIAHRLETIGRREQVAVRWSRGVEP